MWGSASVKLLATVLEVPRENAWVLPWRFYKMNELKELSNVKSENRIELEFEREREWEWDFLNVDD